MCKSRRNLVISFVLFTVINNHCFSENPIASRPLVALELFIDESAIIKITEVRYEKLSSKRNVQSESIVISLAYLRDFFLEKAVRISGEEINYRFSFESVAINGEIDQPDGSEYYFHYNLAGYAHIHNKETGERIIAGDPGKVVSMK